MKTISYLIAVLCIDDHNQVFSCGAENVVACVAELYNLHLRPVLFPAGEAPLHLIGVVLQAYFCELFSCEGLREGQRKHDARGVLVSDQLSVLWRKIQDRIGARLSAPQIPYTQGWVFGCCEKFVIRWVDLQREDPIVFWLFV